MLVALRARVQSLIDEGKTEDEAVAAKPTKDFDAQWVHQGNFLTGDAMTRMAYQSLKAARNFAAVVVGQLCEHRFEAVDHLRAALRAGDAGRQVTVEPGGERGGDGNRGDRHQRR